MEKTIVKSTLFNVAEIELVYKSKLSVSTRPRITKSVEAYEILKSIWDFDQIELREEAKLILLNQRTRVLGILNLSAGGPTSTVVDPRTIFAAALKANASHIILAHNHPSGDHTPSKRDVALSIRLREVGEIHEITLLDSIIITKEGYTSMADAGLI